MSRFYANLFFLMFFSLGLSAQSGEIIQQFLDNKKAELELSATDISNWVIYDEYRSENIGLTHVYIRQSHQGIEVYNAVANFNIKDASVFSMGNRLESNISKRINTTEPKLSQTDAIIAAAKELGLSFESAPRLIETKNDKESVFFVQGLSLENIPVKLMFQPMPEGEIRLVWDMSIYQTDKQHWWSLRIDALTGEILDKVDWVLKCDFGNCGHKWHSTTRRPIPETADLLPAPPPNTDQYRVFAIPVESPSHGTRSLVVGPYNTTASPFGWHDTNGTAGAEFTTTRGNNVNAMEDADGNNGTGYAPNGGASLNFDFPLNMNQTAVNYRDASVTNLFYMNNIMHDIWYQYGFNEVSGNFQENNYGRGGAQLDGVIADAQDGSGTNNANFATPADGTRPRMQMYLWTGSVSYLMTVNSPNPYTGQYAAVQAGFGPAVPATPITANLALMTDATADFNDGCEALTNAASLSGKIAVVRRGTCAFTAKVQAAQNAGAVAVIVVNNIAGAPTAMGGTSTTINIPSIMISQADGDPIVAALLAGTTINTTLQNSGGPYDIDGDFDNGIIAHEYGHGISTRLTGGPSNSNCLDNDEQMGEGWSDWFGLMLTIEPGDTATDVRGIGTFAIGEPTNGGGIRPAPYSTSFTINNFTYASSNNTAAVSMPHGVGFVWCTMLWDMTWDLIGQYGYNSNLYSGNGGNNIAMNLVTTALKLQPCSPGFVDGRNAILQADSILYNGANKCLIWRAFARRGLGFSASQGNSNSRTDQVEAFDLPPSCQAPVAPPDANFTSVATCTGLVNFTDISTNNPTTWRWSFGDGNSSTLRNPSHTYAGSGTFQVKLVSTNSIGSDSVTISVTINRPAAPITANVNICENQTASLNATASGTVTWFDASGNTQLSTGPTYTTPALATTTTYMVQNVVPAVSQFVGPANASIGTSANHNQPNVFTLNFTAFQPFTLVSVWVNASTTGNRTINLYNAANGAGTVIATTTVNITATGAQRITLNLNIPAAGAYSIGGVNMNMLRNNAGVAYPYTLAGVADITSSSAGTGFYYYYYNWEVRTAPCTSPKIPVVANVSVINNNAVTTNAICTANNGTASVSPAGGVSPYTFLWSNGSTLAAQNTLAAGSYTVTATDNTGCRKISTVTVSSTNTVLSSNTTVLPQGCTQLGSATATASNGTSPYSFAWSNGRTTQNNTGLNAGTYAVTITDANGCRGTNSVTVTNGSVVLATTANASAQSCSSLGSATASATNGTAPYSFAWSNGRTTQNNTGLNAGTYSVTITDANGCSATRSVTVANNGLALTSTTNSTAQNCATLGSASVSISNGTAPYSISWSNGAAGNTATNLSAGTYSVSITDANGCTGTNSVTVANNGLALTSTTNSTAQNCATLGSASVSISNGTAPFSISWSNGTLGTTVTNLASGTYTVSITDANGCIGTNSVTVANNGLALTSSTNSTAQNCATLGSASVSISNGTAPYNISWSNGAAGTTASNLSAGTYSVSITDANGCTGTNSVTVANNGLALTSSTNSTAQNCATLGSASVSISNGTAPYSINWSNGAVGTTASNLSAGTYSVSITDANGCTGINSVTVANNGLALTSSINSTAQNCATLGSASVSISNGTAPYSINWSNGAVGATVTNLASGTYSVSITDANGCTGTNSVAVANNSINLNLTGSAVDAACGVANGSASVTASNGTAPYSYTWSNNANSASIVGLLAGTYTVTVTDANGCSAQSSATVNSQNGPVLNASASNISCNGANNGTAVAAAASGSGTYSYVWSNGQTGFSLNNLSAGVYGVTVTDSNGCAANSSVTVSEPSAILLSGNSSDVTVAGGADGAVNLTVSGGSAPYTYNWSNNATTEDLSAVAAGTYSVTVTDANGCTSISTYTVADGLVNAINIQLFGTVNLYPNPADGYTLLELSLNSASDVEIRVSDMLGRILSNQQFTNIADLRYNLDLSNWPAAVYTVQIIGSKEIISKQLIIKR